MDTKSTEKMNPSKQVTMLAANRSGRTKFRPANPVDNANITYVLWSSRLKSTLETYVKAEPSWCRFYTTEKMQGRMNDNTTYLSDGHDKLGSSVMKCVINEIAGGIVIFPFPLFWHFRFLTRLS